MNTKPIDKRPPSLASWISFLVSFLFHLAACLALAVLLIGGQGNSGDSIVISMASSTESQSESLALLELEPAQLNAVKEAIEPVDITSPAIDQTIQVELDSFPSAMLDSSEVRQASAVSARSQDTDKAASKQTEGPTKAKFFGAEASGNRFVFVVDTSTSMQGPRWDALCAELIRALETLSADQQFFVIGFDAAPRPMFDRPPPRGKFLPAIPKSITRVRNWLRSLQLGSNTLPSTSLAMALSLKPDAIFLLSDGEIRDNSVVDLRTHNRTRTENGYRVAVPIHTVLLHSEVGFATLETIAEENDGSFTPVRFGNGD